MLFQKPTAQTQRYSILLSLQVVNRVFFFTITAFRKREQLYRVSRRVSGRPKTDVSRIERARLKCNDRSRSKFDFGP